MGIASSILGCVHHHSFSKFFVENLQKAVENYILLWKTFRGWGKDYSLTPICNIFPI